MVRVDLRELQVRLAHQEQQVIQGQQGCKEGLAHSGREEFEVLEAGLDLEEDASEHGCCKRDSALESLVAPWEPIGWIAQ